MSHVAVTDYNFDSLDIETKLLEPLGLTVTGAQCKTREELIELLADADYVITQFAPVDAAVIRAMKSAKVIVRYGIGFDNVDVDAAREKAIPVCNVPDYCIDEVADHALALILASTRQVMANATHVAQGNWGLATPVEAMSALRDMTVGVVGFGRIGCEVVARLRPFKCRIQVFDPGVDQDAIRSAGCEPVPLDGLLASSDLVTLHCPSNKATFHLIDASAIAKMKNGAILVNVARGTVVCTDDLRDALGSGKISFAALDVLEVEPAVPEEPLRTMNNVLVHGHVASVSAQAMNKLRQNVAAIVAASAEGKALPNIVNGVTLDA